MAWRHGVWAKSTGSRTEVDLRSDTVTRPSEAMRAAMDSAPLGDDVFRDDPTVLRLEAHGAEVLGKEAALYLPSGTMANQGGLRLHTRGGDEIIVHARAHIYNYESGAQSALAGVAVRPVDSDDGSLPLDAVRKSLHVIDDPHLAPTPLIAFENTHNGCGGRVVAQENIDAVVALAREHGIALHLDGARLFNAAIASKREVADLAAPFDTVSVCLSKGLGAPIGSLLAGSREDMHLALRYRKMYGGGMRQVGGLAAAGLHALKEHPAGLADDHRRARTLAESFAAMDGLRVDLASVHTNIVYFDLAADHPLAAAGDADALVRALEAEEILLTNGGLRCRAVTHRDVGDEGIGRAIDAMARALATGGAL